MKTDTLALSQVLSDDAAVTLICAFTRQESGLSTSPLDVAKFFGWSLERARAAGQELVDHGVVKTLATPDPKDVS